MILYVYQEPETRVLPTVNCKVSISCCTQHKIDCSSPILTNNKTLVTDITFMTWM